MTTYNASGTYNQEDDRSYSVNLNVNLRLGAILAATWGPAMSDTLTAPTLCTSHDSFLATFGKPKATWAAGSIQYGWYTVREYFRKGRFGQLVRCDAALDPAVKALGTLRGGRSPAFKTGTDGLLSAVGVRTLTSAAVPGFIASGVKVGHFLYINEDAPANTCNGTYIITAVAAGVLTVNRDWPADLSASGAIINFEVHTTRCNAKTNGATGTVSARTLTSVAVNGENFTTSGVAAGDIVHIYEAAPGSTEDDGVYLVDSVASAEQVVLDRDLPVGNKSNLDFYIYKPRTIINPDATSGGPGGAVPASGDGSAAIGLKTFTSAFSYFSKWGVVAGDILIVNEGSPTTDNGVYVVTSTDSDTQLTVNRAFAATLANLDFYILPASVRLQGYYKGTRGNNFTAEVKVFNGAPANWTVDLYESGVLLESWANTNRTAFATDAAGSIYFSLPSGAVVAATTEPIQTTARADLEEPLFASGYVFNGGYDGDATIATSDKIAALRLFKNSEQVLIDVLAAGGEDEQAVQNEMEAIREVRKDCQVVLDGPPIATVTNPTDILRWSNGTNIRTSPISASGSCMAWPEVSVYDEYNDKNVNCPPSGIIVYCMCRAAEQGGPWKAPAGPKRGIVPHALGVAYSIEFDQRDMMQAENQCVNPLVSVAGKGIMLKGQHTGLRSTSRLNRINNRMTLTLLEVTGASYISELEFDTSDSTLWGNIKSVIDKACGYVKSGGGIKNFESKCNAITNDPAVLPQANSAQGYCWVEFPETAERIYIKWIVTPAGVTFEEYVGNFKL